MNDRALMSGFLMSKLGIALAAILLIGSTASMYVSFGRTTRQEKLNSVAEAVTTNLRRADSLPGEVRLERELPSVKRTFKLVLSGTNQDHQAVRVQIQAMENFQRTIFLNREVNDGEFRIVRKNPQKIIITKSDQISVEVD